MKRSLTSWIFLWLLFVPLIGAQVRRTAPPAEFRRPPLPPRSSQQQSPPQTTNPQPTQVEPQAQAADTQAETSAPQTETAKPETEAGEPQEAATQPTVVTSAPTPAPTGALSLQNASLIEVVDALCRQLKINYILDPRVEGGVILNTYGEVTNIDTRSLLDLILRINGAAMVQVGEIYRIVPLADASRLPISPEVNAADIPLDDQIMLNLVFLKYVTVEELSAVLEPFIGEGASTWAYSPANLLLILDSHRNMRRTMELIAMFDSDTLASQRVRVFEVENGRPSDIAEELETVLESIALGESGSPIKFLPIDRLNLVVAVAPNPGVFEEVEKWLKRLDQPVEVTAGTVDNYVYRVKYGRAENLAGVIMSLYMGYGGMGGGFGSSYGLFSGAASGFGNRYGSATGGRNYGGGMGYGYGGAMGGMGYGGAGYGYGSGYGGQTQQAGGSEQQLLATPGTPGASDLTGSYLGAGGYGQSSGFPRVVPNPMDNTLLILATPQQYKQMLKLIEQLDVPPRQVLIDAKIYEISLTGAFAAGVQAYLQKAGGGGVSVSTRKLIGGTSAEGLQNLSIGTLVGQSRELLLFLQAQESSTRAKVISAPSIIATDSIPATVTIGSEVPTLTAQAVSPIQNEGSSLFTSSIANRDTGVTLAVLARINPTGIVTLIIDQEVSDQESSSASAGGIQSPTFAKSTIQTQVTVRDGDTIAIGGIIKESETQSSNGVPFLRRIPVLGYLFGSKTNDMERTELIVFMTPRVIYDTNQITDATEELKSRFRKLSKQLKEE